MTRVIAHGEVLREQASLRYHGCEHLVDKRGLSYDPGAKVVVSYGGDGTLLDLADKYPQRILLPIRHRDGKPYRHCPLHDPANIGERMRNGERANDQLSIWRLPRIKVINGEKSYFAVNEVCILNENRAAAIRTRVQSRDEYDVRFVGDGLIISTPYGSSGYFRSVARGTFRTGMGVAFANDCDNNGWFVSESLVEVQIERGPATMTIDNRCVGRVDGQVIARLMSDGNAFEEGCQVLVAGLDALFCDECLDSDGLPAGRRHI